MYRSALGKMAWLSLSLPHMSYQISFLSVFQSQPTRLAFKALCEVIRFMKGFREFRQTFGSETCAWFAPDMEQDYAICDASWSTVHRWEGSSSTVVA